VLNLLSGTAIDFFFFFFFELCAYIVQLAQVLTCRGRIRQSTMGVFTAHTLPQITSIFGAYIIEGA
jgi:hypothetical protein